MKNKSRIVDQKSTSQWIRRHDRRTYRAWLCAQRSRIGRVRVSGELSALRMFKERRMFCALVQMNRSTGELKL